MKYLALFLVCLVAFCIASFKPFKVTEEKTNEEGWIELINKKDFKGWRSSETKGTWTVTPEGYFQAVGKRSHLFYEGEHLQDGFKNFELEVQVKTFKLANSGIYFHTEYQETGWPTKGMEIQVNNTHIGEGDYIELKKMASLYGVRNLYKSFGHDGEWMTIKARVESNHVQIWLNGLKTVDYLQPEKTFSVKRLSKGTFCLQGHDSLSKMQYRSFKVRRLPDNEHSNAVIPELGAWHDSLVVWQGKQFAFIDLNPATSLSAKQTTDYLYQTGINVAFVKNSSTAKDLNSAKNFPLFTGLKINLLNQNVENGLKADFVIGESMDENSAMALLSSKKINIWSDKSGVLTTSNADELLDLAKRNNVAIEIDNINRRPSIEVIKKAKEKGCRFSFSGLSPVATMAKSVYVLDVLREARLSYKDQYIPGW